MRHILAVVASLFASVVCAPVAEAQMYFGNYNLHVPGRFDFHTWIWSATPCLVKPPGDDCIHILAISQPVAKAFNYAGDAQLVDGRYTLTVDDPFGLRCGNVYYGPTVPTRDVYTWDARALTGTLESSFAVGCDNAPGGTFSYPIRLARM